MLYALDSKDQSVLKDWSVLKEINPEYSLAGLRLKLKLQYFGHLMWIADSLERPWCWERLRTGGKTGNRGWDGWTASLTQWTWVWANSGRWWRTGRPGVLQSVGLQRVRQDWATEHQQGTRTYQDQMQLRCNVDETKTQSSQINFFFFLKRARKCLSLSLTLPGECSRPGRHVCSTQACRQVPSTQWLPSGLLSPLLVSASREEREGTRWLKAKARMRPLSPPFMFQWPGCSPAASAAREAGKCRPASWPRAQEEEDSLRGRPAGLQHLPSL